jgi:toxin-antitoxin system PIN domain toxin
VSRPALLDVNVLVALFNPDHIFHDAAHDWFSEEKEWGWATCPITENGLVRIISNPKYIKDAPTALRAIELLRGFCASGGHVFWPDDLSLRTLTLNDQRALGHRKVTDLYLLALARQHAGRLVTFDRSIPVALLPDARPSHLVVISLDDSEY